jgi:hypothetical protein
MFFVNHNESKMIRRREDSTPRADDDLDGAACDLLPMPMSLGRLQVAVQDGDAVEARPKAPASLWRKTDFRDQHDRLFTRSDHLFDQLHVDFRLATTGYAMQQVDFAP